MSQRNLKPASYFNFAWGSGNDFLLWNKSSNKPANPRLPETLKNQKILNNKAVLINWEECDDQESKVVRSFAQNLYQFHLQKLEIMHSPDEEQDRGTQQNSLFVKIKEANFSYCNTLMKATEAYQQSKNIDKGLDYLQYFLIWKLADIFYMRESTSSKTQEFSQWIRLFPDIIATKKAIEEKGQCDWDSLFFYLALGDLDNVIAILKNIKSAVRGDSMGFALHETIEVLRKKIKYFKGDDCPYMDKQSFLEQANKERDRFKKNHLKWENNPDFNDEDFLLFLRVLTGDLQSIERASSGDWKLFLNLVFLFHHPIVEKPVLERIMEDFMKRYNIYDVDRVFLSIILNQRAFTFIQSILGELPAWFTFHLSDMLYLFKQIPMEPIISNEYDEDAPQLTFLDIALHELFGYILDSRVPYDIIKYYVFYLFQIYVMDHEEKLSAEYMVFVEQIYEQRMNSREDEDIQNYLHELNDQIFLNADEMSLGLFSTFRNNLLKRKARNYTTAINVTPVTIKESLEVMETLKDSAFADEYGALLLKEFEEKANVGKLGNEAVPTILFTFENEGSSIFQESENLNFLLKYCKFKKSLQNQRVNLFSLQDAKELLIDMILKQNSPQNKRLLVLNYAIDLFENSNVKFTTAQIHGFTEQLAVIESALRFEVNKDQKNYKKIIQTVKLCLMRCLSKSVINE